MVIAGAASATTTPFTSAIYSYDQDAPNAQSAMASLSRASTRIDTRHQTSTPQRFGFDDFLAAEEGEAVSLFKAPAPGRGASQFAEGYKPEDFPGNGAYFAREQGIADSFAYHYGEGVIETRVPADVYAERFAEHEMPYLGEPPGTELAIPPSKLDLLSQFPRFWHGQP